MSSECQFMPPIPTVQHELQHAHSHGFCADRYIVDDKLLQLTALSRYRYIWSI